MCCATWAACNFTKINTPPCVFFMFFKLYKWYQIAQRTTYFKFKYVNTSTFLLQFFVDIIFLSDKLELLSNQK